MVFPFGNSWFYMGLFIGRIGGSGGSVLEGRSAKWMERPQAVCGIALKLFLDYELQKHYEYVGLLCL